MIDGTKLYGKKNAANGKQTLAPQAENFATTNASNRDSQISRRAWFQALVPAFGEGLVKILRESNNLQSELHEALKENTRRVLAEEVSEGSTSQILGQSLGPSSDQSSEKINFSV